MAIEVVIPTVGESVATVFIARWIAKEGDVLAAGAPVLEIDSDKASMEVPAPLAGTVRGISVKVGDRVREGDEILVMEIAGEAASASAPPVTPASTVTAAPAPAPVAPGEGPAPAAPSPAAPPRAAQPPGRSPPKRAWRSMRCPAAAPAAAS